ncbi:MAG: xanthine dehydrogenase family protein subunit M [Gammaproteobacteria bacterium]|nr:xanthine dehydrogenase family protein subunit M [Gammaproteobacteria bacterium]
MDYIAARTLGEALDVLAAGPAVVLAGGTDLMPQSRSGKRRIGSRLLNIRRIVELAGIRESGGTVRIGALTTISELHEHPLVRQRLPVLWSACDHFASDQIRNAATLGGNLCNASPAGDTLVPLLVLGASVVLAAAAHGERPRRLPLADFLLAPGRTALAADELLVAVEVPLPGAGWVDRYLKFGARPALDIATVALGIGGRWIDGRLIDARLACGAVAPTAVRVTAAEQVLAGGVLDAARIDATVMAADAAIRPISDVRASDWYRHELVRNLLRRLLDDVRQN